VKDITGRRLKEAAPNKAYKWKEEVESGRVEAGSCYSARPVWQADAAPGTEDSRVEQLRAGSRHPPSALTVVGRTTQWDIYKL